MVSVRRAAAAALCLMAVAVIAAGCAPTGRAAPSPKSGGQLVIAEAADTAERDPQVSYYDSSWRLEGMVYDSLVTADEKSRIEPSLVTSWTTTGTSYTFTLRSGVKFSNGRAMTADDVVGSLKRLLDPATGSYWAPQLGPVTDITSPTPTTVKVDLSEPYSPFLAALASTSAAILPMKELKDGSFDPTKQMLGTGPFKLVSHTQDQEWRFTANPDYWNASKVHLGGVTVKIVPDDSARIAGLRNGTIDIGYFANPDAKKLVGGVPNLSASVQASSDAYWLVLNAKKGPFVDKAQRVALASAIDRSQLISSALAGQGEATGIAPATLPGACSAKGLPTYAASTSASKKALDGAKPTSFSLMAPPYLPTFKAIAQYLQQDLRSAGFSATIETPEMGDYVQRVYTDNPSQFDAVIDYFAGYLSPLMAPGNAVVTPDVTTEFSGFAIPTPGVAEDLAAAAAAPDAGAQASALRKACTLVADNAFLIPLATKSTTIAVRTDKVKADIPSFDGYDIYLRNLTSYTMLGR